MKGDFPLVSVLTTAYNREKYIAAAIESVLASSYTNFELIVVDDCSKDKTVEIAKSYALLDSRIRVYENELNLGDYPNRNIAASYAKGEFITYLDSDDLIFSHGLKKMVEAAVKYPDAALYMLTRDNDPAICEAEYFTPVLSFITHFEKTGFLETGPLGTLINIECFKKMGGFSGKRMIGDTELWLKLASIYPLVKLEKNLVFWRKHDQQETSDGEKYYLVDMVKVYKDLLYSSNFPIPQKRFKYLIKVVRPRFLQILKLAIKKRSFKKFIYLVQILKIILRK